MKKIIIVVLVISFVFSVFLIADSDTSTNLSFKPKRIGIGYNKQGLALRWWWNEFVGSEVVINGYMESNNDYVYGTGVNYFNEVTILNVLLYENNLARITSGIVTSSSGGDSPTIEGVKPFDKTRYGYYIFLTLPEIEIKLPLEGLTVMFNPARLIYRHDAFGSGNNKFIFKAGIDNSVGIIYYFNDSEKIQ